MEKKVFEIKNDIDQFNIKVTVGDILVYSDNIKTPLLRYRGEFDIKEKWNEITVTEKTNSINYSTNNFNIRGSNIIRGSGNSIINVNGVTIVNGQIISGNDSTIISINNEPSELELIIPEDKDDLELNINSTSGDINIKKLFLTKLIIEATSGDITLNDYNAIYTRIKNISGDVKASILESIINYKTSLNSTSGDTIQNTSETESPILLSDKHHLEIKTISGDINVLFKGKRYFR